MRIRLALLGGACAFALAPSGLAGGAPVAFPVPVRTLCVQGQNLIQLGVVYTANPRGPRWYSLEVRDPRGTRVFYRHGLATRTWKWWTYDPTAAGTYRTIYRVTTGREVFRTRAIQCRR